MSFLNSFCFLSVLICIIQLSCAVHRPPTIARLVTANGETGFPFGRVELLRDGVWGTVCSDTWTNENAKVICRMIGYHSQSAIAVPNSLLGKGKKESSVVLSGIRCHGHETNVDKCKHLAWNGNACSHGQDAGVICVHEIVEKDHTKSKNEDYDYCSEMVTAFQDGPIPAGQLCQPHGYCISNSNGAVCVCEYGYSGEFCQYAVQNELYQSTRCALYPTPKVIAANVTVGCPGDQNCIPDRIYCTVVGSCAEPLGWCLPREEYEKYMRHVNKILNK